MSATGFIRDGDRLPMILAGAFAGDDDGRARAIRAVVAAQWAVACALHDSGRMEWGVHPAGWNDRVAALPTAEQIVDGLP